MSQKTYGYHLDGQIIVASLVFLFMSTLFIDMITFAQEYLNNGKHALTHLIIQVPIRISSIPRRCELCYYW